VRERFFLRLPQLRSQEDEGDGGERGGGGDLLFSPFHIISQSSRRRKASRGGENWRRKRSDIDDFLTLQEAKSIRLLWKCMVILLLPPIRRSCTC